MILYKKTKKEIRNPRLLLLKLFNFLRPYYAVVLTFKFNESKDVQSPIQIHRVNSENINDALIYEPSEKVEAFKISLKQGDWGYYAYIDNVWVHRSWVTFGPSTVNQWSRFAKLNLAANEVQIRWCETSPKARGKNIYPAVLSRIVMDLQDKVTAIYITTTLDNIASQKGIQKAGFIAIKETKVISFMGIAYERTKIIDNINSNIKEVE